MGRVLNLEIGGAPFAVEIEKVDRAKVYGWVDRKAFDRNGQECYCGSLSEDGLTIFGRDSFEAGYIDDSGDWIEKSSVQAVDESGAVQEKVASTLQGVATANECVTLDEFLLHRVKSVYYLTGENVAGLLAKVRAADGIPVFNFNYVASYEPDRAFLVENEGELFMLISVRSEATFIGLEQADVEPVTEDDEAGEDDEAVDFGMM